jgi:hypothetical protein
MSLIAQTERLPQADRDEDDRAERNKLFPMRFLVSVMLDPRLGLFLVFCFSVLYILKYGT